MDARVIIEFHIDEMACADVGMTGEELFKSITVVPDDVIDGCQIFPDQRHYDLASTFLLSNFRMVSKRILD